ncbi:MAG: TolC family protein [Holophagae bacterium]|jgi:outer membrane protein TolC
MALMVPVTLAATVGAAAEPGTVVADTVGRLIETQRHALAEFPGLQAERARLAAEAAGRRLEAAAGTPYFQLQSEGVSRSGRQPNAADYLRVGSPFNFPGQISKARSVVRSTEAWLGWAEEEAVVAAVAEVARRWVDLAAAVELEALSSARLERLDAALSLQEARFQLGEIAGTEVRQLELEHVNQSSRVAAVRGDVDRARAAVRELCGAGVVVDVRSGDLEALTMASTTPADAARSVDQLAAGPVLRRAEGQAELERRTAQLVSATAWGRAGIDLEWERIPSFAGQPGFDALGVQLTLPLPLGAAGHRQREQARARADAADASLELATREVVRSAEEALATARGASDRLQALEPALDELSDNDHALAEQFRLGAISYLAYIDGLNRFDRLVEEAIDARRSLLRARLELAVLLGDRSVFPLTEVGRDEEK